MTCSRPLPTDAHLYATSLALSRGIDSVWLAASRLGRLQREYPELATERMKGCENQLQIALDQMKAVQLDIVEIMEKNAGKEVDEPAQANSSPPC